MNLNRVELKLRAQGLIQASKPKIIYAGLILLALSAVLGYLSGSLTSITVGEYNRLLAYIESGSIQTATNYLMSISPNIYERLISTALDLVYQIVYCGFVIFLLNSIRKAAPCFGNLLDGFGCWWRIILLSILQSIFIFLWSLLFVIPGIIAAYRYRMALYLLLDHPEMSPLECIRESCRMMSGHKAELFYLDLSFIGWILLGAIPYLGLLVRVWALPYTESTYALYYEHLCSRIPAHTAGIPPYES